MTPGKITYKGVSFVLPSTARVSCIGPAQLQFVGAWDPSSFPAAAWGAEVAVENGLQVAKVTIDSSGIVFNDD